MVGRQICNHSTASRLCDSLPTSIISMVTASFCFILLLALQQGTTLSTALGRLTMVEGHSVHRVASFHRKRLVGNAFTAWSPNGRFQEGAKAISGKVFSRIEAVGKNLFVFFGEGTADDSDDDGTVVVHVHFGMAGNWAVYMNETAPEPTKTNRLRLEYPGIVADLSAMTVQHGGMELYEIKRAKLGEDPLRDDADPGRLWERVKKSSKSIGALVMDQSYFTGPGNIYRAEILFKARVHPDRPGNTLEKAEFDTIWHHTVDLLQRGYQTGSILTVDPAEARALGNPRMRRYIYNTSHCPRCGSSIKTWQIAARTCYACPRCQPLQSTPPHDAAAAVVTPEKIDCTPFNSHCARESVAVRLWESGPERLTVKELKAKLAELGVPVPAKAKKSHLLELMESKMEVVSNDVLVSPEAAAAEKAAAGEGLAVEHIAELAPGQARKARARSSGGHDLKSMEEDGLTVAFPSRAITPRRPKRSRTS